jgi:hypothetical protein
MSTKTLAVLAAGFAAGVFGANAALKDNRGVASNTGDIAPARMIDCFGKTPETRHVTYEQHRAGADAGAPTVASADKNPDGTVTAKTVSQSRIEHDFGQGHVWTPYRTTESVTIDAAGVLVNYTYGSEVQRPDGSWMLLEDSVSQGSPRAALEAMSARYPAMAKYKEGGEKGFTRFTELHLLRPIERSLNCTLPRPGQR